MIRLGLCCIFYQEPIKFRTATAKYLQQFDREEALLRLSGIVLHNLESILEAQKYCNNNGIGAFRITSRLFPLKTHPSIGYNIGELPSVSEIEKKLRAIHRFSLEFDVRLSFHPDQFVVLNSPRKEVVEQSISEIEYQTEIAELIGADVVNIHGGGGYGDKKVALKRFFKNLDLLSDNARSKLTVENDDKIYSPKDLMDLCKSESIPFVYDVHHHRCLPDGQSVEEITEKAIETWDREPYFHISSPLEGWDGPRPIKHHDYINPDDFPKCWKHHSLTIDVEAKAKEMAVIKLLDDLSLIKREPG